MAKGWCAYSWGIVSIQYVETLENKPFPAAAHPRNESKRKTQLQQQHATITVFPNRTITPRSSYIAL